MSAATIAVIVVVVAVVVLAVSVLATVHRHRLRRRFGPEYDRLVGEKRSQLRAAAELTRRGWRVQRLDIRPLTDTARAEYVAEWRGIQEGFVDQPMHAVIDADELVMSVMKERGYPAEDHDQVAVDLAVTHQGVVAHHRIARQISAAADRGDSSTEDLRQALIHFRTVFRELLGEARAAPPREPAGAAPPVPVIAGSPAPAVTAAPVPDVAGRESGGAQTSVPEKQLWRPAAPVPEPRNSAEEAETGS